jgi:Transmembrane amino acid transporter protein
MVLNLGQFLNRLACVRGYGTFCNEIITIHLVVLCFSLPLALLPNMKFFFYTCSMATFVFSFSCRLDSHPVFFLTGIQIEQLDRNGLHPTVQMMNLVEVGMFYGVARTAVGGIGLLCPTRHSMKKPQNFRQIFLWTAVVVVGFYLLLGLTGSFVGYQDLHRLRDRIQRNLCF